MKKLQIFIITFIFLLPSIAFAKLYSLQQLSDMVIDMSDATTLSIDGGISKKAEKIVNNNKDLINAIIDVSKRHNVDISYCGYETELSVFSESKTTNYKRVIFTTFNRKRPFKLKSGRRLNSSDGVEKFLSSEDTGNKDQVGILDWMNLGDIAEIRPWYAFEHTCFWLHSMIVHTKDSKVINDVVSDFKNTYGVSFRKSMSHNEYLYSNNVQTQEYKDLCYETIIIIMMLYVIILVHSVFFKYKKFAIMKLNGVSNLIILRDIVYDAIKVISTGLFITFAILFTYLIYRRENDILGFFKAWIYKASLLSLMLMLINVLLLFLIAKVKIPIALKNKKPINVLQNVNYMFKAIFCSIFVSYMVTNTVQLNILLNGISSFEIWQQKTSNKVDPFGALFGDNEDGSWWSKSTMILMKNLYDVLDKEGKVIYADFGEYSDNHYSDFIEKGAPYYLARSVTINNNYLKENPIYDINGQKVNVTDESPDTITLLVLENLKKHESDIIKRYSQNNRESQNKKVNIIYVKEGQKYFTYDLGVAENKNNILTDIPVVTVCNRNNLDLDFYCCNGLNLVKINNMNAAYEELLPYLKEVNLDNMFYSVRPIMWEINLSIYTMEMCVAFKVFRLFFAVVSLILLIISSSINYIEKDKLKHTILKIHGIPFLKRYMFFYVLLLLIWVLSFVVAKDKHNNMQLLIKVITIASLVDITISTVILKIYENKKISSVLKGE